MAFKRAPSKDPINVEPYYFTFADPKTALNDGSKKDKGRLQGATIASITNVTITPSGSLTADSYNFDAVTIRGIEFPVGTVVTVWLSGGTVDVDYEVYTVIVTSDGRTLKKTMIVPVILE